MATKLEIFNLALGHLAMKQITDATDTTSPSGKACNNFYKSAKDDTFRENQWPFAFVQEALVESDIDDDDIPLPWIYAYEYPVNADVDDLTAWSGVTAYVAGDKVSYGNLAYVAILSGTNHQPDTATTYWAVMRNIATVWNVFNEAVADKKHEQEFEVYLIPGSTNERIICSNLSDAVFEYTIILNDTTLWDSKFTLAVSYKLAAQMAHILTGDAQKGISLMNLYNAMIGEAKRISAANRPKKPNQTSSYQNAR